MRVFYFDVFTLDLSRYALLRGDHELALRPKAFDVLKYLVEHPEQVVTKEALFEDVWDGAARTDGSLVQCIKDIREVLGDTDHQLIKTIPKRGYLLSAKVSTDRVAVRSLTPQAPLRDALSLRNAARYVLTARWHAAALLAAVALIIAAGVAAWAVRTPPPSANAAHYVILGRAILDNERSPKANKEALALFNRALSLDAHSVTALINYARTIVVGVHERWGPLHERSTRLDQAEVAIERAIKLDPGEPYAHFVRGSVLRARSDPERAIAAFERALELQPDDAWARAELGRTKIEVGRADEAIRDIETAIRLKPAEPVIYIWYFWAGVGATHAGKGEAALQWLLKAKQADGTYYPFALSWLALAHAELGQDDEARALMAERLTKSPALTVWTWKRDYPPRNATVAMQRERITAALRRLGVPEGKLQTGSIQ